MCIPKNFASMERGVGSDAAKADEEDTKSPHEPNAKTAKNRDLSDFRFGRIAPRLDMSLDC